MGIISVILTMRDTGLIFFSKFWRVSRNFILAKLVSALEFTLARRNSHSPWRVWRVAVSTPGIVNRMLPFLTVINRREHSWLSPDRKSLTWNGAWDGKLTTPVNLWARWVEHKNVSTDYVCYYTSIGTSPRGIYNLGLKRFAWCTALTVFYQLMNI